MTEVRSNKVLWDIRLLTRGVALLTLACSGEGAAGPPEAIVVSVEVSEPPGGFLNVGASRDFSAQATYSDGSTRSVTAEAIWTSSDTLVMTIHPPATGEAVGVGEADICVSFQTATDCRLGMTVIERPPFGSSISICPDIITASDITTLDSLPAFGQSPRSMYDRRAGGMITVDAHVFFAIYDDSLTIEVLVNPEFDSAERAEAEARKYAEIIGRLPTSLRRWVDVVFIHRGVEWFQGGNNMLLIYTGTADLYEADGVLEEVLVHEATHTSINPALADYAGWRLAQALDARFISLYAQEFPFREDMAESFLPYLALRFRLDRIPQPLADTILMAIPNRIEYLDRQVWDMYPITRRDSSGIGRED